MFCPHCGTLNDKNNYRCTNCGTVIQGAAQGVVTTELLDSAAMRWVLPVGRSGLAIAAGYAALFAFLILPAPLALILGVLAILDIRKNPSKHGMGRAVFGVAMGGLGTAVLLFMLAALT